MLNQLFIIIPQLNISSSILHFQIKHHVRDRIARICSTKSGDLPTLQEGMIDSIEILN